MTDPHDVPRDPGSVGDLRLTLAHDACPGARIKVVGVGGGGGRQPDGGLRAGRDRVHRGQH